MRLLVLAALAVLTATPARAHDAGRLHNIRHVAERVYGPGLCEVGTMRVPVRRRAGLTDETDLIARFHRDGGLPPWTGCRIEVDDRRWSTRKLCRLVAGHELGHAAGREHASRKRRWHIMNPLLIDWWEPCARRFR